VGGGVILNSTKIKYMLYKKLLFTFLYVAKKNPWKRELYIHPHHTVFTPLHNNTLLCTHNIIVLSYKFNYVENAE